MSVTPLAPLLEQERLDLFAIYVSTPSMHHLSFEAVLADPTLRGCLRNTLEAKRRAALKKRQAAAVDITKFQLT